MPGPYSEKWSDAERELDRALCNFTNGASDEYEPALWREETKRNFKSLCDAYNNWHVAKRAQEQST